MLVEKLRGGLILAGSARRIFGVWDTTLDFGVGIQPHVHEDFEEVYYILSGRGRMRIGDEEEEVGEGALVYIPPGKVHTIACTSAEPLRFVTLTVAVGAEAESSDAPYIA